MPKLPILPVKQEPPTKNSSAINIKTGYPQQIVATNIIWLFPESNEGNRYILAASVTLGWGVCYTEPGGSDSQTNPELVDDDPRVTPE